MALDHCQHLFLEDFGDDALDLLDRQRHARAEDARGDHHEFARLLVVKRPLGGRQVSAAIATAL
jgi:hypothetical protein